MSTDLWDALEQQIEHQRQLELQGDGSTSTECCEGLAGWALAWHHYSAHGGPYPRRSRKAKAANAKAEEER